MLFCCEAPASILVGGRDNDWLNWTIPLVKVLTWNQLYFSPIILFFYLFFFSKEWLFSISSPHGALQKIVCLCPSLNSQTSWENLCGKRTRVTLSPPSSFLSQSGPLPTSSLQLLTWPRVVDDTTDGKTLNLNIIGPPVTHLHSCC